MILLEAPYGNRHYINRLLITDTLFNDDLSTHLLPA